MKISVVFCTNVLFSKLILISLIAVDVGLLARYKVNLQLELRDTEVNEANADYHIW